MPTSFGYHEELPENIRDVFMRLCQDVVFLRSKWSLYNGLFGDPDTARFLSETARSTFQMVEESLRVDMAASISRLCDPRISFGRFENISLKALADRLGNPKGILRRVNSFVRRCEPVTTYRNKRIGHNDLDTIITPKKYPLPGITRRLIDKILIQVDGILNSVIRKYVSAELIFDAPHHGGAEALIRWLKKGKRYEDYLRHIGAPRVR